jgi:hypothetical protein
VCACVRESESVGCEDLQKYGTCFWMMCSFLAFVYNRRVSFWSSARFRVERVYAVRSTGRAAWVHEKRTNERNVHSAGGTDRKLDTFVTKVEGKTTYTRT